MFIKRNKNLKPVDFPLLACTLILVCFGIVMVFSASYYYAQVKSGNPYSYVTKQVIGAIIGFIVMWIISRLNYNFLKKSSVLLLIICFIMLILVIIPGIGIYRNGARRWLGFAGIDFQPAEISKFGIILFLAHDMSKRQDKLKKFRFGLLPYIFLLLCLSGLIIIQPNLSMVICIAGIWFALMFAGGIPNKQLIIILALGIGAITVLAFGAGYRSDRMAMFLDPWKDPSNKGYQVIQSLYSVASGGFFGTGLGNSRQKMLFLPYRESDFIFAIIAEELGFFGIILLFSMYLFLFWRGIKIALSCDDMFGSLVATGVVASIAIQMILNVGVAIKLVPATGLTLPFISAGLTSLIVMMANVGLLLNISRNCSPRRRKE